MCITQRSPLLGAIEKHRLTIVLFVIIICFSLWTHETIKELKVLNNVLSITINNQTNTIEELQSDISELEIEKEQLKNTIDELQEKNKTTSISIGGSFKSYTDYKMLSKESAQWKLQEQAYTDENGFRKIGDAYLVALGSYYGRTLGSEYTVTLKNGNVFQVILCDQKQDRHTDKNNQVCISNGSILEFYVDTSMLPTDVLTSGTISSIDFFAGDIASIVQVK